MLTRNRPGVSTSALARLSGDEFTLMLTNVEDPENARLLGENAIRTLRNRVRVGDREIFVSASIGAAYFPTHGRDAEQLLHHAEIALAEAKRGGGGMVRLYSESFNKANERTFELKRALLDSFERHELQLHYQPLVLSEGRIIGAEALLRWEHPQLGSVSPAEFVPVAEESGLMRPIGHWVLRTACGQLRAWMDEGLPPIRMAVNVSLCQLSQGDLPAIVREALEEFQLDPSWLELELSERGVLRSDPDILKQLTDLKEMGVRLSVDDFGTGESAIAYLRRFPLDTLKLDRSYVDGVVGDENDAAIISAMIAMAHQLRLGVVAEGVESKEQLGFLRERGCDEYQGFLFSPAVPAQEFLRLLDGIDLG
jgi:EAL domain-containing protein (putative c-di-GMP-specific phosphodiesterase class I)